MPPGIPANPSSSCAEPDRLRICIIQSAYIPWRGFFDLIGRCDEYVVFDSAQYVKRHWHNRNRIKTARGAEWLTIPVVTKGKFEQRIDEVEVEKAWADKHWRSIELAYARAPYFAAHGPLVRELYERAERERRLTDINWLFVETIVRLLAIGTRIVRDTSYASEGTRTARLLSLCRAAGATRYLSGPSATAYFEDDLFRDAGIEVEWMNYDGYTLYPQLHGAFEPAVSVLDLIFNAGADAARTLMRANSSGSQDSALAKS
jgi:hypothetical protein